ncbi:hypothetical protein D3C72_2530390 [compost metagenome]
MIGGETDQRRAGKNAGKSKRGDRGDGDRLRHPVLAASQREQRRCDVGAAQADQHVAAQ